MKNWFIKDIFLLLGTGPSESTFFTRERKTSRHNVKDIFMSENRNKSVKVLDTDVLYE